MAKNIGISILTYRFFGSYRFESCAVKLRSSVKVEKSVLFLMYIGKLCIAECAYLVVFQKTCHKSVVSFYKIINHLSDVNLHADASDFRTMRRIVADSIIDLGEYHRFSKGIFAWVGFNTCYIPYTACERVSGTTKWNFRKLFNYAIDGIIGFSTTPLRIATALGFCTSIAALIYLIVVILEKLILGIDIPGYATIIVLILFLGGMQLLCLGIIGEYVNITDGSQDMDEGLSMNM